VLCLVCGGPLEQATTGRPRKTCSKTCRNRLSLYGPSETQAGHRERAEVERSRSQGHRVIWTPPAHVEVEAVAEPEASEAPGSAVEDDGRLSFREDPGARRAAVRGLVRKPKVRTVPPVPRAEPTPEPVPGPGLQLARVMGQGSGHRYQSGKVDAAGGFAAVLSCGHGLRTPAPLALGYPVRCPTCGTEAYRAQTMTTPEPRRRWGRR
jgi:hypothetical protein